MELVNLSNCRSISTIVKTIYSFYIRYHYILITYEKYIDDNNAIKFYADPGILQYVQTKIRMPDKWQEYWR